MLGIFTAGRSLSGIYRELRQLRRMAESYFEAANIPLPRTPYERLKEKLTDSAVNQDVDAEPQLSEEETAARKVKQVVSDLAAGRDPGTDYRPW